MTTTEAAPIETTATPTYVRIQGMGSLMLRGRCWWIRYSHLGKRHEENSKSADVRDAEKLLRRRIMDLGKNRRIDPTSEHKVKMAELFDTLEKDYTLNGRKSAERLKYSLVPLREHFGTLKALDVTAARVQRYISERHKAKLANGTINRELAVLKRALSLAVEHERLSSVPKIKMLREAPPRQGFVKPGDFEVIASHLPEYLQDYARAARILGRRKTAVAMVEWKDVDRAGQILTLRRDTEKNGEPSRIPFIDELADIIGRRWKAREYQTPTGPAISRYVFHNGHGRPPGDFRKSWTAACVAAGFAAPKLDKQGRPVLDREGRPVMRGSLLFHDLRRSAVRNLTDAGVDQVAAMRVTGHKTASVFHRYRIVNDEDVKRALERTEAAIKAAPRSNVIPMRREA
jgi:hypothetical protein